MNICNITFQVLRLSTFVFKMCSEKNSHDYIVVGSLQGFGPNNGGPASQTVAYHHWANARVIWCFCRRDVKASPA